MNATIKTLLRDVNTIRCMRGDRCYNNKQIAPIIRARDFKIYKLRTHYQLPMRMIAGFAEVSTTTIHFIVRKYAKLNA